MGVMASCQPAEDEPGWPQADLSAAISISKSLPDGGDSGGRTPKWWSSEKWLALLLLLLLPLDELKAGLLRMMSSVVLSVMLLIMTGFSWKGTS
jgi:hypothetical protein